MIFGKRTARDQRRKERETKRRRLSSLTSRSAKVETLEERRLLAVVVQPTINLENADDTGMMNLDNVTSGDPLQNPGVMDFFLTADAGTSVVIRDGNTVINDQLNVSTLYLSLDDSTTLSGGVEVENEDIVAFNGTDFSLFFDGSEAGIESAQLDAFAVIGPTEILLSFTTAEFIPDVGFVDASDIVRFTATQMGEDMTSGTFSLLLDGSNVGLDDSVHQENVDAVDMHHDGRLIISTKGDFNVPGLSGDEEDLIAFTPDTPGDYSTGTWAIYFDGSDVDIAGEDIDAVALDPAGNIHFHLSTTNEFDVPGLEGEEEDAFTFFPTQLGDETSGTYSPTLLFNGSQFGLGDTDVTGMDLLPDFDALDLLDGVDDGIAKVRIDFNVLQDVFGIPLQGDHLLSVQAFNSSGKTQSEQLLVTIDTIAPAATDPSLAETSESGNPADSDTFSDDKTNKMQPAFVGTAEANAKVRVYANGVLVGQSVATSEGDWEITVEPLVDGEYEITTEVEDLAGNITASSDDLDVIIDSTPPQRPTLDLPAVNDSGMFNNDNVTNNPGQDLSGDQVVSFTISAQNEMGTTVLVKDGTEVIFGPELFSDLDPEDGFATIELSLGEGTHALSVESIDMAGNISHQSEELVVEIDRTKPDAAVVSLADTSDSGTPGDNKTNLTQPAFVGTAEANAKVRIFANGVLVGQGVATSQGNFEITVEPLVDGMYTITTEVEDLAGNICAADGGLVVMIDTVAPQRPTLDLENADDTGMMSNDNVTFGDPNLATGVMDFFLTADPGTSVLIKDGNTVINSVIEGNVVVPPTVAGSTIYLSLNSGTTLPGNVVVENEDVIAFDGTNFSIFIDGSDVGLGGAKLDALAVISDTEVLLSFTTPQLIPGITDLVENTDIVKFTITQSGDTTEGTYELFFRGGDNGLEPTAQDFFENIDAVDLLADGRLIVSTQGDFDVPGVTGNDEDLIAFTPDTPGDYSAGTWAMFLDGSDVEIGSEDIDAAAVALDSSGDQIHISTTSSFSVTGLSGDEIDAFTFLPTQLGDDTAGSYSPTLLFDGSLFNLDGNDVSGMDLVETPGSGGGVGPVFSIGTPADFDTLDLADGVQDGVAKVRIDFNAVEAAFGIPVEGAHLLSVESIDMAGNISHQSEQLVVEIDRTAPDDAGVTIDMAGTSQTGTLGTSVVTNKMQPAFVGTTEANAKVRLYAVNKGMLASMPDRVLIGQGVATSQGNWEITVEPLVNGHYTISVEVEDLAGNITMASDMEMVVVDPVEPNDSVADATELGSETEIILNDVLLHDETDTDFYSITAHDTGKLVIDVGQAAAGSFVLTFHDSAGNLLVTDGDALTDADATADGKLVVPVVRGQSYIIQVANADASPLDTKNFYDLEIENFMAPVPTSLALSPADDSGMSNMDNTTFVNSPTMFVQVDLSDFEAMGIAIDGSPGADVEVSYAGISTGDTLTVDATRLGTGNLWTANLTNLAEDLYFINARVSITDHAGVTGFKNLSVPTFVTVDTTAPAVSAPDMLDSSDTGMSNTDDVTNKMRPAFSGTAEANAKIRVLANGVVVGNGVASSQGNWEVTVEPLSDGVYDITVVAEDKAGNVSDTATAPALTIEIDTLEPNTPLLDLVSVDDSGMSNIDNITNVNPATFTMTTTDPNQALHLIQENYKFRVFNRPEGGVERLIYNSVTDPLLTATNVDGLTAEEFLERELQLEEGVNNLKLEVEDRAGNFSHDFLLQVVIDTIPPVVGDLDLIDSSDSGMSNTDNVTNKMQPAITGTSEAGAKVRIFAEPVDNQGNSLGVAAPVGSGVVASDGTFEVTLEPLVDGIYNITAEVEDAAGNTDTTDNPLTIEIDTLEPNTPLLDLATVDDNGHSDTENVTNVASPTFTMTSTDPNQLLHLIEENYKFRVFDRLEGTVETLIYNSVTDPALTATNVDGLTAEEFLARELNLAEGVHNLKLEVEDRAGNISHDFLLDVEIDLTPPEAGEVDLISSSDSGMSSTDNVTNITQPAFFGRSEVNSTVRVYAEPVDRLGNSLGNAVLIGSGTVGSDQSDVGIVPGATDGDDQGVWEVTVEPLDDGIYEISIQLEDWAGNIDPTVNLSEPLTIEIDTLDPNTAFLDLVASSDTGRHDEDNITNDSTPTFTMTTTDPNQADHLGAFNYKFRIYDRIEGGTETLIYNSVNDLPVAQLLDGLTDQEFLEATLNLAEGVHNLKLEVEDRAGNISHDYLLDMVVDITAPDGDLQTIKLDPDSDTGVWGFPETMNDGITADKTPEFVGAAEANALVTLTIDGVPSGTTVAVPFDGNDAFPPPADVDGNYRLQSINNLDDGVHTAFATFTDVAGNSVQSSDQVQFTVDSQGSRITGVEINNLGNPYDLFDPKPSTDGPTPPVTSLVISIDNGQLFEPLATSPGNYRLVGDHSGIIPIQAPPIYTVTGTDTATITLNFFSALPDDRFTLTISDNITDAAGNGLDGESNADEPQENPTFPSGDGAHGGDFVARFTVDSRPEIATWSQGVVYADINGNFVWDPEGQDNDATNRDFVFNFGEISNAYFVGNFANGDDASGFDKLGVYGKFNGTYKFVLDTDDDGVADTDGSMAFQVNAIPIAGNFDGNAANGDEIGAFDGQNLYLDVNGDNNISSNERFSTSLRGRPLVGDFNGDGNDDFATFNDDTGVFRFDLDLDGSVDDTLTFGFSGFGERPLAGDMNLDGVDDIALWVPKRQGQVPNNHGEFHFLVSDNPNAALPSEIFNEAFSPAPLGNDLQAQFGDDLALPLLGNFDPPVSPTSANDSMTNESNPLDTNVDGRVTALDALVVINALSQQSTESEVLSQRQMLESMGSYRLDANNDGAVTALDALRVINALSQQSAEGESQAGWAASADDAIADLDDEDGDDLLALLALDAEQQRSKS